MGMTSDFGQSAHDKYFILVNLSDIKKNIGDSKQNIQSQKKTLWNSGIAVKDFFRYTDFRLIDTQVSLIAGKES